MINGLPPVTQMMPIQEPPPVKPNFLPQPVKNPLERVPVTQRHRLERIMFAVEAALKHRIEVVEQFMMAPDGKRVAFNVNLTSEEMVQRFMDVPERKKMIEAIAMDPNEGPERVKEYLDAMMELVRNGTDSGA